MKVLSTAWFRCLALAMAACVYVGAPLMLLSPDAPWGAVVLTGAVVLPGTSLIVLMLHLLKDTKIPRGVIVVGGALIVGVVAGPLIFWSTESFWFGLVICVPIALVAAGVGLIMEWIMIKVPALALLAVIVGGSLLLSSIVGSLVYR